MAKPSKKHHFVPRSLLRRFSVDGAGDQIWVLDKSSGKSFSTSLMNAGSQNDFNKLQTADGEWNFESVFDENDGDLAKLGNIIAERRSVAGLSRDFRRRLADVVAVQILRTPIARSTLQALARDLVRTVAEAGLLNDPDSIPLSTDNDARRSTLTMMSDRAAWRAGLQMKDLVLFEPSGPARFWISDHPVVRYNPAPNGDTSLQARGVEIYLPLASDLMLGLLCSSVKAKLHERPLEALDLEPAKARRLIDLREGLRTGGPVGRADDVVMTYNRLQVAHSARFLYAARDDFGEARAMLEADPSLASVDSLVTVGKLGGGLPRVSHMPPGQMLVLYGRRSWHQVPITDWDPEARTVRAATERPDVLALAMQDAPFEVAELYQDGQQRRMMREVRVVTLNDGPPVRFEIRFSDPSMEALDRAIARA